MSTVSIYDSPGLDQLRRSLKADPLCVRRMRNGLLKQGLPDETALAAFPAPDQVSLHTLELFQRHDSTLDGATKLLFRTADALLIESVILRIASGRTTLCISSQVGCAVACEFCATGKMGLRRNLSSGEMLDQVLQSIQLLAGEGRRLRNIVFMGMGEPLHNEEQLCATLDALTLPELFHFASTRILVSTVGVPDAMLRLAGRYPTMRVALSLHSVDENVRQRLIPLAWKYPLEQLRCTLEELNRRSNAAVMIEYLLLAGVNDSLTNARQLIEWLSGLNVHVNLIPYNSIEEAAGLAGSDEPARTLFAATLKAAGLKTTLRYSLGSDIAAACGQLVRHENRRHHQARRSTSTEVC